MEIGNIKMQGFTFKGNNPPDNAEHKKRYKHYEEVSDEVLGLRSLLKAKNEVENSSKMRLYKAMPKITTGILATGMALTQPGQLAAKAAAGLGFLALNEAYDGFYNTFNSKDEKPSIKKTLLTMGAFCACALGGAVLVEKGLNSTKAGEFIKKEFGALSKEINSTKLGKFTKKTVEPFYQKHSTAINAASVAAGLGAILGLPVVQNSLAESMQKDFQNKTKENFKRGKLAQLAAKEHFSSIDAIEV